MQKKKKVAKKVSKVPSFSYKISVRFTEKEAKRVAKLAKKLKLSKAALVRALVVEGFANHQ